MRRITIGLAISLFHLFWGGVAIADFVSCGKSDNELREFTSDKTYSELAADYVSECSSSSGLMAELRLFIERIKSADNGKNSASVRQAQTVLLSLLDETLQSNSKADRGALSALKIELQCDKDSLSSLLDTEVCENNIPSGVDSTLPVDKWRPRLNLGPVFEKVLAEPFRTRNSSCLAKIFGSDPECDQILIFNLLPALEFQSVIYGQLVAAANSLPAAEIAAQYDASHLKWKNYLALTGLQYPWELTLNKYINGGFGEIAKREEAPNSRLVVLHPSVGIAHTANAPDGDQVDFIGMVKLLGFRKWRYDSNKPGNVWGMSLITTFADIPEVDDAGLGLLVEYNQFGLGISRHGSDTVVTVTFDLRELLGRKPKSTSEWLQLLEGS